MFLSQLLTMLSAQGELIDEQKKCDEEDERLFYDKVSAVVYV